MKKQSMTQTPKEFYSDLQKNIQNELFDQEKAVATVTNTLFQNEMFETKTKLKGFFTFIGKPNSGKHYLCELLLKYDTSIENIKTFYMDQYSSSGMAGYEQFSATTFLSDVVDFVQTNPNSIIVFEDMEKAELSIQLALYTLFTDYDQELIDFSNIIAVVTTTLLCDELNKSSIKELYEKKPLEVHTYIIEKYSAMKISVGQQEYDDAFDKKLLSFMNEHTLVVFNALSLNSLFKIGFRQIHQVSDNFVSKTNIQIEYKQFDKIVSLLVLSLSPYINARYVKQKLPKLFFELILDAVKQNDTVSKITLGISKKAKLFLQNILEDENQFLRQILREDQRVFLSWKFDLKQDELKCQIKDAYFDTLSLHTESMSLVQNATVKFDDVAGHQKVKKEFLEIIELFKDSSSLKRFDLDLPKGMILKGPKGMGKKLLAKAFAGQMNLPFVKVSGSQLFDLKYIQTVFESAKASSPSVVIFEDIDTQGLMNGVVSTMSLEPIINQLDKIHQSKDSFIFTILTTSDEGAIIPDILEANRIDIQIEVPKLDMEAREFFIQKILQKPCEENIDVKRLVKYISGMGGDELNRIGQEASLYAARKGLKKLTQEVLLEQINIIKYGTKLENKQIRDIELSMSKTAYHEAGHAVLSYVLLPKIKIEQVTIAPRSEALGFVSYHNEDYIDATSKADIFNDICVLLAGRIAKMHKYGEDGMETGAISDLEVATAQSYAAIALFGMDEELGYINVTSVQAGLGEPLFKEKIEQRVLKWIDDATKKTESEVARLWKAIEAVALALIDKEVIDGDELKAIIEENI